jgi:hypothetical protein
LDSIKFMQKRLIPAFIVIAYSAILIKLLVFKTLLLKIGPLRIKFSPEIGQDNFLPFKTIFAVSAR